MKRNIARDLIEYMSVNNLGNNDLSEMLGVSLNSIERWIYSNARISPSIVNEVEMLLDKTYLPVFKMIDTTNGEVYVGNIYTIGNDLGVKPYQVNRHIERERLNDSNAKYDIKVIERGDADYWKEGYDQWV